MSDDRARTPHRAGRPRVILCLLVVAIVVGTASVSWRQLRDIAAAWLQRRAQGQLTDVSPQTASQNDRRPAGYQPHPGHDDEVAIALTRQGQQNVGLQLEEIQLDTFQRTISIPAIVVERPGRSRVIVSAPLTGIVTRVYPMQGEAVEPGMPLFELRLTHEELVQAQAAFLQTAEELDVVRHEAARLEKIVKEGAIAATRLLERTYEQQKLEAVLRAQKEGLILHGLSQEQIERILEERSLLQGLRVVVPSSQEEPAATAAPLFRVQQLEVDLGQHVEAGDPLCILGNHAKLFIEGKAFADDSPQLNHAAEEDWGLTAVLSADDNRPLRVGPLKILYIAGEIEPQSRALPFYVRLKNTLLRDVTTDDGHRFVAWKFRPGQRGQIEVPVERWPDRIVLPAEAVVTEGAETYVFQQNGGHFDRRPVHVEFRDPYRVVLANDGSLFPGDIVVTVGAYQLHQTMRAKSGQAIDPHAGHSHD